jgi:hypothetical protein
MIAKMRRRVVASATAFALAVVPLTVALASAQPASAYTHEWSCFAYAYERCFDNAGKTYNPWHRMSFDGEYDGGYCVKGETSSGGVIQFDCENGTNYAVGTVCTGTETHAYGYSNINGQVEAGLANTEGGC